MSLALQLFNVFADDAGFFFAVPETSQRDLFAFVHFCPKGFTKSALIRGNEPGRGTQNMGRGSVILFQTDDFGAGEVLFKAQDVVDLCAAPAID